MPVSVSRENISIAQGHTWWQKGIREATQSVFNDAEPTYLTTGLVSNTKGTSRNGHNIRNAHINEMPVGEQFTQCLVLPRSLWSSLRIEPNQKCNGCNRKHRALGHMTTTRLIERNDHAEQRDVPILKNFGLHCAIHTALMTYYAEIVGMVHFGYITDKLVAQQAINVALRNGTSYLEYCGTVRDVLMGKRVSMPDPPETEPYPIVPCLTIDERVQYWSRFSYDKMPGQLFTRGGELYRVEHIVPVGDGKMNCFQCVHVDSGEYEPTTFAWDTLQEWIANSLPQEDRNVPDAPVRPPAAPARRTRAPAAPARRTRAPAAPARRKRPHSAVAVRRQKQQHRNQPATKKRCNAMTYKRLRRANNSRVRRVIEDTESESEYESESESEHEWTDTDQKTQDLPDEREWNFDGDDDNREDDEPPHANTRTICTSTTTTPANRAQRTTRRCINYAEADVDSDDESE